MPFKLCNLNLLPACWPAVIILRLDVGVILILEAPLDGGHNELAVLIFDTLSLMYSSMAAGIKLQLIIAID